MKILVTGGAGFIGSHLAERLLENGEEVYVLDNLSTGKINNLAGYFNTPNFHFVQDDLLNLNVLYELCSSCDLVYHLAAALGVANIVSHPLPSLQTNIEGIINIYKAASKFNNKVIFTSSSEIYGKYECDSYSEDSDRLLGATKVFRWSYSYAKAIGEYYALAFYKEQGVRSVIVRLFNTVGPRQTGNYGMVLPRLVQQALKGEALTVYAAGQQKRCFTDVSDVVDCLIQLSKMEQAEGECFNIGSDSEISILELAKLVIERCDSKSKIVFIPYEKVYGQNFEDTPRRLPDLSKIRSYIGYQPKLNIVQIVDRVIEYYRTEQVLSHF